MFAKYITVLKHDDLFISATWKREFYFHQFWFKQDYVEFVSDDAVSRELGPNYILPRFQLTLKVDIRIAKKQILERRITSVIKQLLKQSLL